MIPLQLMEGEKNNQVLRGELRDQEELVHRMMSLETENNALSAELGQVGYFANTIHYQHTLFVFEFHNSTYFIYLFYIHLQPCYAKTSGYALNF